MDEYFPREGSDEEAIFQLHLLDINFESYFAAKLVNFSVDNVNLRRSEGKRVVLEILFPLRGITNHEKEILKLFCELYILLKRG